MSDQGVLGVGFEVDLNSLTSGLEGAKSQIASVGGAVIDSNDMALASYDELASGVRDSMSSIAESTVSASSGLDEMAAQGSEAGSSLIEVLLSINESVKDVQYAVEAMSSDTTGSIDDLAAEFSKVEEGAQSAGGAIADAGSAASGGGGGGGFLAFFNQIGIGIFNLQNMANMAQQLGSSLLGPAVSAETVTSALTTLDGSAAAASREMDQLNQFAAKTPFKTLDIDQAAEQLQGFGINAGNVVPDITAIGDALGSVGRDTPAELDSVVQIFGKIHTEGKITAATMNELAIHGINGWQALADATGKTIPQVKDLVSKGLLPADQAISDLTSGIEKNPLYQGGMAKAAGTFTGLLSTLQSNWDQVIAAFGTPIIKALEGSLNNLGSTLASPAFQQFAGSVGQGLVTSFQDIGGAVQATAQYFGSFDLGGITYAFKNLGNAVSQIVAPFQHLGDNKGATSFFVDLKNDLSQGLVAGITSVGQFIGGLADDLKQLVSQKDVTSFLGSMKDGFSQVQKIVGGGLGDDFQFLGKTVQQLGQWWQSSMVPAIKQAEPGFEHLGSVVATTIIPALAQIWANGQKLSREVLPPLISAFEAVEPIIVRVGGFLADKLGSAIQTITPDIVAATGAITDFVGQIITRVEPIIQNLWKDIKIGLDWIGPYWPSIWLGIQDVFTGVWDILKGAVQIAWSVISGIIKVGLDIFSGNWGQAWNDIKDTFSGVWDGIKSIATGIWSVIGGGVKAGINGVISQINGFIDHLDSIGIDIGSVHIHPNVPEIPYLATGGFVPPGGMAIAGDPGPNEELVFGGTQGATVLSHSQSLALLAGSTAASARGGNTEAGTIHIHVHLGAQEIGEWMADATGNAMVARIRSQGPVGKVA